MLLRAASYGFAERHKSAFEIFCPRAEIIPTAQVKSQTFRPFQQFQVYHAIWVARVYNHVDLVNRDGDDTRHYFLDIADTLIGYMWWGICHQYDDSLGLRIEGLLYCQHNGVQAAFWGVPAAISLEVCNALPK